MAVIVPEVQTPLLLSRSLSQQKTTASRVRGQHGKGQEHCYTAQ